jgi:hypothetical protein
VEFSTEMVFPAPAGQVAQMLATEAYVQEKIQASGATSGSVEILGSPDGAVTITTRRRLPTSDVPASYRSLVGSSIEVREVDAWEAPDDAGGRRGTLVLDVTGAPVRVTGTLELRPTSQAESVVRIAGDIKASVPFVGKTIEKAIAANVERAADVERRVGADWLARH